MRSIEQLNRELARLDAELRGNRVDRSAFRARRRQLLMDFDERESTTTPGIAHAADATQAATSIKPQAAAPRAANPGLWVTLVAAVAIVTLGALWFFGARNTGSGVPVAQAPAEPTAPQSALPQGVADALMKTEWREADVEAFLKDWSRLSPESVHATHDDPHIWLLRGEAEQRLRAARDAESVDPSPQAHARSEQLQRLLEAIRTP